MRWPAIRSFVCATLAVATMCMWPTAAPAQLFSGSTNNGDLYNSMPAWQNGNWLGQIQQTGQEWKLGVQGDDLDTGVYIRQVAPGSAAARASLEPSDIIVAVGGQQVGIVDGRYVDFSAEIRRRADTRGNVGLLVQDGRSGKLTSIRVQLDGNQTSVRGFIVRRDRSALPSDATVTVSLENVTRPFYAVRNGQATYLATAQNNIPFEINYDPSYIDSNDQYELRAQIVSNNRVIYRSNQAIRIFGGAPTDGLQVEVVPTQTTTVAYPSNWPVVTAGYGSGVSETLAAQYTQIYRRYLGRDPFPVEMAGFMVSSNPQAEVEALPLSLMAGQQYYDAVGNNNTMWMTSVFQQIIGRQPTNQERDQWLQYLNNLRGSRMEVLRQLVRSRPQNGR